MRTGDFVPEIVESGMRFPLAAHEMSIQILNIGM